MHDTEIVKIGFGLLSHRHYKNIFNYERKCGNVKRTDLIRTKFIWSERTVQQDVRKSDDVDEAGHAWSDAKRRHRGDDDHLVSRRQSVGQGKINAELKVKPKIDLN